MIQQVFNDVNQQYYWIVVGNQRGYKYGQLDNAKILMDNFTQLRAAARRKTLILLWWIDGGKVVVERSTLARQGLPWGSSDYARMVCELFNLLTLSTVAMGLLL